jgi:hypothetical protein
MSESEQHRPRPRDRREFRAACKLLADSGKSLDAIARSLGITRTAVIELLHESAHAHGDPRFSAHRPPTARSNDDED